MNLLPRAEIQCPLSKPRVYVNRGFFLEEMYENFVSTQETVRIREVSVWRGSTVDTLGLFIQGK